MKTLIAIISLISLSAQAQVVLFNSQVVLSGGQVVVASGGGGGGGGGAWHYSIDQGLIDTTEGWMNDIVPLNETNSIPSGTATKLRVYIRNVQSGGCNLKMALYDSGGTRLAQGVVNVTSIGYAELTGISVAVTAGTYRVAWTAEVADRLATGSKIGTGYIWYEVGASYTLPDPWSFGTPDAAKEASVGVFVE